MSLASSPAIWAIGDIHGRLDLMIPLLEAIRSDVESTDAGRKLVHSYPLSADLLAMSQVWEAAGQRSAPRLLKHAPVDEEELELPAAPEAVSRQSPR